MASNNARKNRSILQPKKLMGKKKNKNIGILNELLGLFLTSLFYVSLFLSSPCGDPRSKQVGSSSGNSVWHRAGACRGKEHQEADVHLQLGALLHKSWAM